MSFTTLLSLFSPSYHLIAMSLALIDQALLSVYTSLAAPPGSQAPPYTITTINEPLPMSSDQEVNEALSRGFLLAFIMTWMMSFGVSFLLCTCIMMPLQARRIQAGREW